MWCLSVNYRSGIGYGLNFREAIDYGASGASEYNDVQGAGLYLRGRADVDRGADRGVGWELWRVSDGAGAGASVGYVCGGVWTSMVCMTGRRGCGRGQTPDPNAARVALESSPMASVKTWKSPVLLIQGDDDRNVAFSQTVTMAAALRAQGVPFEEHVFPDEIHGFLLHRSWVTAYGLSADFFNRHSPADGRCH